MYRAAVADDEEIALAVLDQQQDGAGSGPSRFGMEGWTYERELLVGLTEAVLSLRAITIAVNSKGGKVPKVQPLPRPRTAIDRAEAIRSKRKRANLLAQLFPVDHQTS